MKIILLTLLLSSTLMSTTFLNKGKDTYLYINKVYEDKYPEYIKLLKSYLSEDDSVVVINDIYQGVLTNSDYYILNMNVNYKKYNSKENNRQKDIFINNKRVIAECTKSDFLNTVNYNFINAKNNKTILKKSFTSSIIEENCIKNNRLTILKKSVKHGLRYIEEYNTAHDNFLIIPKGGISYVEGLKAKSNKQLVENNTLSLMKVLLNN